MSDNTFTSAHLRAALERALIHQDNPAIRRLPESERTVEWLARAYLPRSVTVNAITGLADIDTLDLTDPGTAHAVLVALALADGWYDPGPLGLGVAWYRSAEGWCLDGSLGKYRRTRVYHDLEGAGNHRGWRYAPSVAAEPDPIKALALALLHVLGGADVR